MERETRLELANLHHGKVALYQLSYSRKKALSGHPLPVVLAAGGHWSGRGFLPSRFPEKESRRQEVIRPVLDSEGGGAGGNRTLI